MYWSCIGIRPSESTCPLDYDHSVTWIILINRECCKRSECHQPYVFLYTGNLVFSWWLHPMYWIPFTWSTEGYPIVPYIWLMTGIDTWCCYPDHFYQHGLTLIPAWISNHIHYIVRDANTYPFMNFNRATVEVWEWISDLIPHFTVHVIIY